MLAVMCVVIVRSTAFGMLHDDGIYLVTAKALAEGHGYRIISLPNEPVQTKYPILLPLLLAAAWRIDPHFPGNAALLKAVPVGAMLGWLLLCYWFARRYGKTPAWAALWIVFFAAANQWSVFSVGTLMSDSLFAALALAAIALLVEADRRPSLWIVAAAGIAASAAYYTRTAGLPLAIAGALTLAARKRFQQAALFSGIVALFIAGWALWQRQAVDLGTYTENFYTAKGYVAYTLLGRHLTLPLEARIFVKNLYFLAAYPAGWIFCFPIPYSFRYIGPLLGAPFWLIAYRGFKRSPSWLLPAQIFTLAYLAMLVVYIWPPDRFLLAILPLLLLFAYFALPSRLPKWALPALAVMPLVLAFYSMKDTRDHQVASLAQPPWVGRSPVVDWSKISQVHNWIRDHAAPGAVVLANYDPAFYLYSGHQAIRPYYVAGANLFYGVPADIRLKISECLEVIAKYRARYIVETGHDDVEEPDYARIIAYLNSTGRLRLIKEVAPHYRIFEILPDRAGTEPVGANSSVSGTTAASTLP